MDPRFIYPLIPITAIIGVFAWVIARTLAKSRERELEIRARIAMIERGMIPSPEKDPASFERAVESLDRGSSIAVRHRRSGIILIGVGIGLTMLIGLSHETMGHAIGVCGFLAVLGLAFLINSLFERRSEPPRWSRPADPTPPQNPPIRS